MIPLLIFILSAQHPQARESYPPPAIYRQDAWVEVEPLRLRKNRKERRGNRR